jgi:hypothetical protein
MFVQNCVSESLREINVLKVANLKSAVPSLNSTFEKSAVIFKKCKIENLQLQLNPKS